MLLFALHWFDFVHVHRDLPKFLHYVDFAERRANVLDCVYTNIAGAYREEPTSDSQTISVMRIPAYRPLDRRAKPTLKQVKS